MQVHFRVDLHFTLRLLRMQVLIADRAMGMTQGRGQRPKKGRNETALIGGVIRQLG